MYVRILIDAVVHVRMYSSMQHSQPHLLCTHVPPVLYIYVYNVPGV